MYTTESLPQAFMYLLVEQQELDLAQVGLELDLALVELGQGCSLVEVLD